MLKKLKELPTKAREAFGYVPGGDARKALAPIERALFKEWREDLQSVNGAPKLDLSETEALQSSIENLTDCYTVIRRLVDRSALLTPEEAASSIAVQIETTKDLIADRAITGDRAQNVAFKTLNILFAGRQELKRRYSLNGGKRSKKHPNEIGQSSMRNVASRNMSLSSALMFQLREQLFPAERMIVGAGRRNAGVINIDAVFDVTGVASSAGVKADPERLARALIAMANSGTYFAMWVHSHPGRGPNATSPSSIDLRQHADWLKDYSPDLVSAIMVADRFIRFWGTAVETGKVVVDVVGEGISASSPGNHIYKLEV